MSYLRYLIIVFASFMLLFVSCSHVTDPNNEPVDIWVQGVVTKSTDGTPIPGATVYLYFSAPSHVLDSINEVSTDEEGRYSVIGLNLVLDKTHTIAVIAHHPDLGWSTYQAVQHTTQPQWIDLQIQGSEGSGEEVNTYQN